MGVEVALIDDEDDGLYSDTKPRYKKELIDGVVMMSPSANWRHSDVNGNIYKAISRCLKDSPCKVYMENMDFKYHPHDSDPKRQKDYLIPDIMIACERELIIGGAFYGVPKFIVETLSPSSGMRDKVVKLAIYEKAGVDEYWIVTPSGAIDCYWLEDEKYKLHATYILNDDERDEKCNAHDKITLRSFPSVVMELGEVFK